MTMVQIEELRDIYKKFLKEHKQKDFEFGDYEFKDKKK